MGGVGRTAAFAKIRLLTGTLWKWGGSSVCVCVVCVCVCVCVCVTVYVEGLLL